MTTSQPNMSLTEALEKIRGSLGENTDGAPVPEPSFLDRKRIARAVALFQPRELSGRLAEDEAHLKVLTTAIGTADRPTYLDPITVWWGGDRWYVIDGHHRLVAYDRAGVTTGIPVGVFKGSLEEAMAHSAASNSKDKLPMRLDDKLNYAWRLVVVTNLSKAKIAEATGVSNGTLGNMRTARVKLLEKPEATWENLSEMRWKDAKMEAEGTERDANYDPDEALKKRASEYQRRLIRTLGNRVFKDTDAFALALKMCDDRLPGYLMESKAWGDALRKTVTDMRDEYAAAGELQVHWDQETDY